MVLMFGAQRDGLSILREGEEAVITAGGDLSDR